MPLHNTIVVVHHPKRQITLISITSTSPFSPNWSSPVNKSSPELHLTYKKNNFSLSSQITSQTVMPTVQVQPQECMEMPCAGIQMKQHEYASSVFKLNHSHTNIHRQAGICVHIQLVTFQLLSPTGISTISEQLSQRFTRRDLANVV